MAEGNEFKYVECHVAFIDILGFEELVKKSQKDPAILTVLVQALNYAADPSRASFTQIKRDNKGHTNGKVTYAIQVRAFSDSIVLFVPAASGGLSSIMSSVRYVHDRMLELGCVIRGAMTLGDMYYEKEWGSDLPEQPQDSGDPKLLYDRNKLGLPITLGPAMIEAHLLESTVAIYPRVLISEKLIKHLNDHENINKTFSLVCPSPDMRQKRIIDFIRQDSDGEKYFDLLHKDIHRNDTERIVQKQQSDGRFITRWERTEIDYEDFLKSLRDIIIQNLHEGQAEKVKLKYQWLKNYFNLKCDDSLKITAK